MPNMPQMDLAMQGKSPSYTSEKRKGVEGAPKRSDIMNKIHGTAPAHNVKGKVESSCEDQTKLSRLRA